MIIKTVKINDNWKIEIRDDYLKNCNPFVSGYIIGKYRNDSFIKYDKNIKNGKIAYDYPEILPKYVKDRLRKELNKLI